MRDLLVVGLVLWGSAVALKRPWVGVVLWTWISIMNPHRYTWGFAYDAPLAAICATCTLAGLAFAQDRENPVKGPSVAMLLLFMLILTLSWLFGLDVEGDYAQWKKVMKVYLMTIVGLAVLRNKQHLFALMWVAVGSLVLLGIKGGVFTVVGGGEYRVWGPPGSFIEDNNEFALALIMTIPLVRFLQTQLIHRWQQYILTGSMLLMAVAALGSYSRGALLAIAAMAAMLWWRSKNKLVIGIVLVIAAVLMLAFMPEQWAERMSTIREYEQDGSALGRISAWWNAWNLAFQYPLGVGFNPARYDLFARFSPYPDKVHAAHSIYFQVLGNHGFPGLITFLLIGFFTWRDAAWLRANAASIPQAKWAADLGSLVQVSMAGFAVGGAFLSLSYFDLPYVVMTLVVLARVWVQSRGWEREPVYQPSWRTIPGLAQRPPRQAQPQPQPQPAP